MKIAITGASGFLGQQLVPYLQTQGVELLVIGRDKDLLRQKFPGVAAVGYDELCQSAQGYDLLLHLAAINNDRDASAEQFTQVNVDLAVETCRQAQQAGIKRFTYISSTHALDPSIASPYAQSKRAAPIRLADVPGIDIRVLYLPAVIGDRFVGKLAVLNSLPTPLRRPALLFLSALRPTVHARKVGDAVLRLAGKEAPADTSMVISDGQDQNLVFRSLKRFQDIVAALAIIVFLWWAMVIIWFAIRLQSPGPGFFRQDRVGRNGKIFTCYKFRTMDVATPNVGTHEVTGASVTALGRFLRRSKLDELPQVLNILLNQMSLVGPRPCLPSQIELVSERHAKGVLRAKPGITGLAQINGIDMSNPRLLAVWDEKYLNLQSIMLDADIILKTALGKGSGDNVR